MSGEHTTSEEQVSMNNSVHMHAYHTHTHTHYRYGAGFTLQAKVKLVPPPVLERAPSKRMSFRRQGSTREHSVPTHDLESSGVQVVAK